jgi:deoxyribodipyrimidine photo-lyase
MIQEDRIAYLNEKDEQEGKYIIYWMQASQRVKYNQALETTIRIANKRSLPVLVYFEITTSFPDANLRHYYFMLEGLQEVKQKLNNMGIQMIIGNQDNSRYSNLTSLAKEAVMVITDCGYLRFQIEWREKYAQDLPCLMIQVEGDVVIPVESISSQEEFNAGSFRAKVHRLLADYLQPMDMSEPQKSSLDFRITSFPIDNLKESINQLAIDTTVPPSPFFHGGESEAERGLDKFISEKISRFEYFRKDPSKDVLSHMSPYLHFGQISPCTLHLAKSKGPAEAYRYYLEELIVRAS